MRSYNRIPRSVRTYNQRPNLTSQQTQADEQAMIEAMIEMAEMTTGYGIMTTNGFAS